MKIKLIITIGAICVAAFSACNTPTTENKESTSATPVIVEGAVTYTADTVTANGFITYDSAKQERRPVVLIVHEWWGINDYIRDRAKQLAALGYIAMAVDMYGNAKTADNPTDAQTLAIPSYMNPQLTRTRLDAAIAKVKTHPQADTSKIAAIGYCYGGFVVINAAKLGADLDGVVSFHGNLSGAPANKDLLKSKILVCHGEADPFVPKQEVDAFRKSMDSINADYTFKAYPGALHAFTNPKANEWATKFKLPVAYDAKADSTSWNDMKEFFSKIF